MRQFYHRLLLLLVAVTATLVASAQGGKIYHSREGKLTPYLRGELQTVIDNSQTNDTIFLAEGTYPGFYYRTNATIIGQGSKTIISGDIQLACDGSGSVANFDGFEIAGYIFHPQNHHLNLVFRNITMKGFVCSYDFGTLHWYPLKNVTFISCYFKDRCQFNEDNPDSHYLGDVQFINCYFEKGLDYFGEESHNPDAGAINLINCNLPTPSDKIDYTLSAYNCIFRGPTAPKVSSLSILKNCAYVGTIETSPVMEDCYPLTADLEDYSPETLLGAGLVGNDGKAIGHLGGQMPYSLNPSIPMVEDKEVEIDYENNVINVTLKFSGLEE